MVIFMDKEEYEVFWLLRLLYLNIYWLVVLVELGIINFFFLGGINKWGGGFFLGKLVYCKEF